MKKLIFLSIFLAQTAFADTCAKQLMPAFTAEQAKTICTTFAGSADVSLVPGTTATYDLGSSSLRWLRGYFSSHINTSAGNISATAGNMSAAGDITSTAGDVVMSTSGKTIRLQEATAGDKCMGSGTFNGTTAVVVSTTCALTASRVFLTPTSDPTGSTAAYCWISAISNGVSFSVDCDQANDGTFNWIIINEAA